MLTFLIFVFAVLYSSVGHAGATGYLAAMSFAGLDPAVMRPAALMLNILVAGIGTIRFARAGFLPWRVVWPLAIASVPCAFLGGSVTLPAQLFKQAIGVMLLLAAVRLLKPARESDSESIQPPMLFVSLPVGAVVGFVAGLTGTGGGVFLTPILLFMRWAKTRDAAGISVAFILLNSIAGLLAKPLAISALPSSIWLWLAAAGVGGAIGTHLGTKRLAVPSMKRLLGLVLIIAAVKMLFFEQEKKLSKKATACVLMRQTTIARSDESRDPESDV